MDDVYSNDDDGDDNNLSIKTGMSDRFAYGRGRQRRNAPRGCGVRSTVRRAPARQLSHAVAIVNKGKTTPSEARWQLVIFTRNHS